MFLKPNLGPLGIWNLDPLDFYFGIRYKIRDPTLSPWLPVVPFACLNCVIVSGYRWSARGSTEGSHPPKISLPANALASCTALLSTLWVFGSKAPAFIVLWLFFFLARAQHLYLSAVLSGAVEFSLDLLHGLSLLSPLFLHHWHGPHCSLQGFWGDDECLLLLPPADGPLVARVSWRTLASCLCTWSVPLPLPPVGLCPPAPLDALGFPEDSEFRTVTKKQLVVGSADFGVRQLLSLPGVWQFTAVQVRSEVCLWRKGNPY